MSDFVTNLARRSVGLTPLVAPRALPPMAPLVPEPAVETPRHAAPPAHVVEPARVEPLAAPALHLTIMHATPGYVPPQLASSAPETSPLLLQPRTAEIQPAALEPARIETTIVLPTRAEPAMRAAERVSGPTAVRVEPAAHVTESAPTPPAALVPDLPAPLVLPVRAEPPAVREPAEREFVPFETVRELTHRFERIVEPSATLEIPPATLGVMHVAVPAPQRVPEAPTPESRVVHVRIGSIEIHGAAPAAAPAPSVVAATPVSREPTGGFDRFARLRSYAHWQW
jgi:hypothetical protein